MQQGPMVTAAGQKHGWQPGQSGNPKGGSATVEWFRKALKVAAKRPEADGRRAIQRVADKLIEVAAAGDVAAMRLVAERLDGAVVQRHDVTTRDETLASVLDALAQVARDRLAMTTGSVLDLTAVPALAAPANDIDEDGADKD